MKKIIIFLIVLMIVIVACSPDNTNESTNEDQVTLSFEELQEAGYVSVKDGEFYLNGEKFRFAGTNNYYLNYKDEVMIEDVILAAKSMNLKVIRMWGFLDGMGDTMVGNNAFMQTEAGIYNNIPEGARSGFEAMDYAVKVARENDIKLVIAFVNNWDAFGGVKQYVEWSETAEDHDDFYTDEICKSLYKDYVNYLLHRENTLTGIVYKEDPTIMTWELMNEPRAESDPTASDIYEWVLEMSSYVKSLDSNHLVAIGDEGFFMKEDEESWAYNGHAGIDFERNLAIESIDYGTFHLYPEHWGEDFSDPVKSGEKWIRDHVTAGKNAGKPVVLEEFGIQKTGSMHRDYIYENWIQTGEESGLNGTMFWILTGLDSGDGADSNGMYPDYDSFRVTNDGGRTATLLSNHALRMSGEEAKEEGHVYILSPITYETVKEVYAFKGKVVEADSKLERLEMTIDGINEVFELSGSGSKVLETQKLDFNGETIVRYTAYFEDGSISEDATSFTLNNRKMEVVVGKEMTFDNDVEGFVEEGIYMAEFGEEGVSHSSFGDGALKVDILVESKGEWQELRVVNKKVGNLADYIRVEYDLYYEVARVSDTGISNPYAVANPGWIKLGLELNKTPFSDLEIVNVDNVDYYKHHISIPIMGFIEAGELYIGIVSDSLSYKGPVYLDDIKLYQEVYID